MADRKPSARPKGWTTDLLLGAAGVALGLTCAFFPWYIFLNQDEFGPPVVRFEGTVVAPPTLETLVTQGAPLPLTTAEIADIDLEMELDPLSTGNIPDDDDAEKSEAPAAQQPFPAKAPDFRIVHASAGRAMVQDDGGIFIVQRGAVLPDASIVKAIEQKKDGSWVVVTDRGRELSVTP